MKFDNDVKTGGNNNVFIKLKDGDKVTGVLRGDFAIGYVVWDAGKTVKTSAEDPNGKFQAKINIVVTENGALKAKILNVGGKLYDAMKELSEAGYDLEKVAVTVKRTGSTMNDTKYSIVVVPKSDVTPEVEAQLQTVALHDLNRD